MNQQLEEIQRNFIVASDLLRVKTFVKHLKKENMSADVLHMIATTYATIERVKEIAEDINKLHNIRVLNAEQQYQLYLLEDIKQDLNNEIRAATTTLESKTNLMARKFKDLSVMEDLDKASSIFKDRVLSKRLHALRTLKNKN